MSVQPEPVRCEQCESEVRNQDEPTVCHECENPSCESVGCGSWCAECGEWTCADCTDGTNEDGDAVCSCCANA